MPMNCIGFIAGDHMKNITKVLLYTLLSFFSGLAFSQAAPSLSEEANEMNNSLDEDIEKQENAEDEWQAPKLKTFTKKQIKAECRKYRNTYIWIIWAHWILVRVTLG